jgi:hypothetical protein
MGDGCPTRALSVIIGRRAEALGVFHTEGMAKEKLDAHAEIVV